MRVKNGMRGKFSSTGVTLLVLQTGVVLQSFWSCREALQVGNAVVECKETNPSLSLSLSWGHEIVIFLEIK